jgi:hypothetical protein
MKLSITLIQAGILLDRVHGAVVSEAEVRCWSINDAFPFFFSISFIPQKSLEVCLCRTVDIVLQSTVVITISS